MIATTITYRSVPVPVRTSEDWMKLAAYTYARTYDEGIRPISQILERMSADEYVLNAVALEVAGL